MELEELKSAWLSLEQRLDKQEVLKDSMIKEMMRSKADKSLNRLSNYEWFGLAIIVIVLPLPLFLMKSNFSTLQTILSVIFFIMLLYAFISQIWKIYALAKVDFSKSVGENVKLINRFDIYIRRERISGYAAFPLVIVFFTETFRVSHLNIDPDRIVLFLIFVAVAIVFSIWQYVKFYKKNISSILKSLDNLKELEE